MVFIAHFIYLSDLQASEEADRRHGEFNLLVEAADLQSATGLFKQKLERFRDSKTLFPGHTRIFLVQAFEFESIPADQAVMLSYKSVAGDPVMPFISCSAPTEDVDGCSIYDWTSVGPRIDGEAEAPFMEF